MKRAGGRRFYRPQDIAVLRGVRALLHDEGYTIKGVQKLHREQGVKHLVAAGEGALPPTPPLRWQAAVGLLALRPAPARQHVGIRPDHAAPDQSVDETHAEFLGKQLARIADRDLT